MARLTKSQIEKLGYKFRPIIRNRDENGHILTYSVFVPIGDEGETIEMEKNNLRDIYPLAAYKPEEE